MEQAGSAVAIETPFDAKIATLAAELDATRMYYGSDEERSAMAAKVDATARLHASASVAAQARRGAFNASEAGSGNLLGEPRARGRRRERPSRRCRRAGRRSCRAPLFGLSRDEQQAVLKESAAKRQALQQEIAELAEERDAYIEDKVEAAGGAKDSLDQQIYEAVREQAAPLGLRYEDGPKF